MTRFSLRRSLPTGAWSAMVASLAALALAAIWALVPSCCVESALFYAAFVLTFPVLILLAWPCDGLGLRSRSMATGAIVVGADGLLVKSEAGQLFMSFHDIAEIRAQGPDRVRLRFTDGTAKVLGCNDSDELEKAIIEPWRAFHGDEAPHPEAAGLQDSDPRRALARSTEAGALGGFRERAVRDEDIARVAVDPRATATDRALAVHSLGNAGRAVRAELRVAIEQTANPEVHDALAEALAGELTPDRLASLG